LGEKPSFFPVFCDFPKKRKKKLPNQKKRLTTPEKLCIILNCIIMGNYPLFQQFKHSTNAEKKQEKFL